MLKTMLMVVGVALPLHAGVPAPQAQESSPQTERASGTLMAQSRSCKAAGTCREAVIMWCGGYSGADRDGDGIPCENVCRSLAQVEATKREIDC
jgi:hypothetical protein